jgi:hypothetical protein
VLDRQAGKGRGQTTVQQMDLGRRDEAVGRIAAPRGQAAHQKEALQHGDVVLDRLPAQAQVVRKTAGIEQLRAPQRQQFQQPPDLVRIPHPRHVPHVAFDDAAQVLPVPLPGTAGRPGERFGIAAGNQPLRQRRLRGLLAGTDVRLERAGQQQVQESAGPACLLGLGQRVQLDDLHAPGQRLGDRRRQQQIGRAGQQKATGMAVLVHGVLDGGKKCRSTLNLVHGRSTRQTGNEAGRILGCGPVVARLVQTDERAIRRQLLRQRGLAALPRAEQADDGRIRQSFPDGGCQRARKQRPGCVHLLVSLAADCWFYKRLIAGQPCVRSPVLETGDHVDDRPCQTRVSFRNRIRCG